MSIGQRTAFFNHQSMPSLALAKLSLVGDFGAGRTVARTRNVEAMVHADNREDGQSLNR